MTGIVSIDIEPGGPATPVGYLGICEIGPDCTVGSPALIRFRTPLYQGSWEEWTTSCEEDLQAVHSMRSETEVEQLRGRWDISSEIEHHNRLFGFSPLPDPFDQAEFRRPEPEPFRQVWAELGPRLTGKTLTAYNAGYDKAVLKLLLHLTDPNLPTTNHRWIDGLAVARHYKYWEGRYGSPTEMLRRELFEKDKYSESDIEYYDLGFEDEYLEKCRQQQLAQEAFGTVIEYQGGRLQDVAIRLDLFTSDQARLRALAHREWGIGNKALLHDAADDAWANAEIIATALRTEGLPVSAEGLTVFDALLVDPDPSDYPAHQSHLAEIEPIEPVCAQFLTNRAQAQIDRCIRRICGIQLSPEQWTEVYTVWEAAARWRVRLAGVSESEQGAALADEANHLIQASHSVLRAHQRGRVYANALSNWLEANRKQLTFQGHTAEQIEVEINRLCDEEEHSRVERRRRTHKR
ncbi:hypothetical protein [Nocardia salmonicida]|uniref:hypothetical protein n=1 Tax=Nocardia salmonicida TaxID=53431 RepID=UPI0007A51305|nr:hypothetical protein [Nocardia salmonicida]MBC7299438.1 hypothetical protein [Nocardia sp.]